jgi:hypothetical protein
LKYLDHRHPVAIEIDRRLLVLDFNTGSSIPAVFNVRRAKVLLCAPNTKDELGLPWRQSQLAGVLLRERFNI